MRFPWTMARNRKRGRRPEALLFRMKAPLLVVAGAAGIIGLIMLMRTPGKAAKTDRHDRRMNAVWAAHGWLGADEWFDRYNKKKSEYRNENQTAALAKRLRLHGIRYVYPHLCPAAENGDLPQVDKVQTERFLDGLEGIAVLPWVGGVLNQHCFLESSSWRQHFVSSIAALSAAHPRLAGIHLNLEPLPSGNTAFLTLLDEIRAALPEGKILSVAAFPPPTIFHPFSDLHWEKSYYRQVAKRADQLSVMLYDTALRIPGLYQKLTADWTEEILTWVTDSEILLGVPVYDDEGVGYHHPDVENLENALLGIHAGLDRFETLPSNYAGIAIYAEWEMDEKEWRSLGENFGQ